jgi:hypothetical protein
LVREVGDPSPARTAVFGFEDGEVRRSGTGVSGCGEDGAVCQLRVPRVGDGVVAAGGQDGVVDEEAPGLWLRGRDGRGRVGV